METVTGYSNLAIKLTFVENVNYTVHDVRTPEFSREHTRIAEQFSTRFATAITSNPDIRINRIRRYQFITGSISTMWMVAAVAAVSLHSQAEPFFALLFSTFSLYVVFAIKVREARAGR